MNVSTRSCIQRLSGIRSVSGHAVSEGDVLVAEIPRAGRSFGSRVLHAFYGLWSAASWVRP
jgi:hypothetical protein